MTHAALCDGHGECGAGTSQSCGQYLCGGDGKCRATCATAADCVAGRRVRERQLRAEAAGRAVHRGQRVRVDDLRAERLLRDRVHGHLQVVRDPGQ